MNLEIQNMYYLITYKLHVELGCKYYKGDSATWVDDILGDVDYELAILKETDKRVSRLKNILK